MSVIPAMGHWLISVNYDPTGLAWADMFDNVVLGWAVDDATAVPLPVIIGSLPPAAPATDPVVSPQWANLWEDATGSGNVLIPDIWRGNLMGLFDWLATNNGATRKVRGNFVKDALATAWGQWAAQHPDLVWDGVTTVVRKSDAVKERHVAQDHQRQHQD